MSFADLVPTPHRKTHVEYDVPEAVNLRPSWGLTRRANQIALAEQAGVGSSSNVALLPSGAWCLRPLQYGMELMGVDFGGLIIDLLAALAIAHLQAVKMQKIPALPGITIATDTTNSGNEFLSRRVPAGEDWSLELAADAASYAKPTLPTEQVRMRRVLSGAPTYPAEQGYCVRFWAPGARPHTHDVLTTFYFGGDTTVHPAGVGAATGDSQNFGGAFCATFYGDGNCELRERGAKTSGVRQWIKVMQFRYSAVGKVAGEIHSVYFIPHGERMDIFAESSEATKAARLGHGPDLVNKNLVNTAIYTTNASVVRYQAKEYMTGPGTVRLDIREDLRTYTQLSRLGFKQTGTLVDHVFTIPFILPPDTRIFLRVNKRTPFGTNITAALFDATTRMALTDNGDGSFMSNEGQSNYYAQFTFTTVNNLAGTVYLQTPFLYSYEIYVPAVKANRDAPMFTGGVPVSWNISGPTSDPTLETAHLVVEDLTNQLPTLRFRGRIHTRISTEWDPADPSKRAVLFEGELTRATGLRKGRSGRTYPSPEWRHYDCPMVSMWARLKDQLYFGMLQTFLDDPEAPPPVPYLHYPPRITTIIKRVMGDLGIPEDMLDIPALDLRAFIGGKDAAEYVLNPTANTVDYLQTLIRDHLGHHLLWDANAGPRGMWRLRPPTPKTAPPIWSFVGTHPGTHKVAVNPASFPARTSYYRGYTSYVRPPECNYVIVTTLGEMLPDKKGSVAHTAWLFNANSYQWKPDAVVDTNHPDYLGRFVPLVYFNTLLGAPLPEDMERNTKWICRRLFEQAAHAQKWVRFSAPLVLVDDPADAHLVAGRGRRPLRYYDPMNIDGELFFVHSVTMRAEHDHHQQMEIEALAAVTTTLESREA